MTVDLCTGISVSGFGHALTWYEQLLGTGPDHVASGTGAVRDLAERRSVFIEEQPANAGHARHAVFVDDLDARVQEIAARGLDPVTRETCGNGVRKAAHRDPDGNEIGFGDAPTGSAGRGNRTRGRVAAAPAPDPERGARPIHPSRTWVHLK